MTTSCIKLLPCRAQAALVVLLPVVKRRLRLPRVQGITVSEDAKGCASPNPERESPGAVFDCLLLLSIQSDNE